MSKMCELCGKKPLVGNNVSHAHNITKRRFNPNLQRVRAVVGPGQESLPWYELDRYLGAMLGVMDGFVLVWIVVVFLALSFGLVNTMMMAVFERVREIGLMQALGLKPAEVLLLSVVNRLGAGWVLRAMGAADESTRKTFDFIPYTPVFNVTGQPSMSVPLHMSSDGLPVGMMFTGRFGDEATLFRLAGQLGLGLEKGSAEAKAVLLGRNGRR